MRMFSLFNTLVLVLAVSGALTAQCPAPVAPGIENLDSLTLPAAPPVQGILNLTALPTGWTHDVINGNNSWRTWSGPPGSYYGNDPDGQTGPISDHTTAATTATGNYLYTESSGNAVGDTAIVEVCFDVSTLALPALAFWYHMHGSSQGTLQVEQSLDGGISWPVILFTMSGPQGTDWHLADNIAITPDLNGQAHLRFVGISGGTWRSDMAIDDIAVGNAYFATNSVDGACTLDNLEGSTVVPLILNKVASPCGGVTSTLTLEAAQPGALFEMALNSTPLIAPGFPILGDTLNINTVGMTFLIGGPIPGIGTMPGALPPFIGPGSLNVTFTTAGALDLSLQSVFTAPTAPSGWVLSQPMEYHLALGTIAPFGGPSINTGDDSSVLIDLTSPTTCFSTTGFSFNGTVYTTISLESNGRITFGTGDSDYSPTLTEALNGDPFIGFWTDLTPPTQPYTVSNPAPGVLRVDIVAGYYPVPTGLSFAIEIDDINQQFSIDGLLGITAQIGTSGGGEDQFLGLSVGLAGGATDPAATTTFTVGGSGATAVGTDMLYDFLDTTIIPGTGLAPSLSPGTLNNVTFFYQGASSTAGAGFAWTGS